jgi:hypothetical protein
MKSAQISKPTGPVSPMRRTFSVRLPHAHIALGKHSGRLIHSLPDIGVGSDGRGNAGAVW